MNRWNEATPKDSGDEDDSLPDSLPPRTARRLGNLYYSYHPHRDGNEDDETEPLTPRDTTSLSSTEVLEMRNTSSYLSYFRSPPETQRANNTPASSSLKKRDPPQTLRPQITTPISRSGTLTHRRLQTPYTPSTQDVYYDNSDDEQSLKPQSSLPPRTEPSYVPAHYSASKGTTPGYLPRNRISLGAESRRSLHSSNSYDGLESVSVGSHLYGESLLSAESMVSTSPRIGSHIEIQNHSRTVKTQPIPVYDTVRSTPKRKQLKLVRSYQNFMHNVQSWTEGLRQQWAAQSHRTALPMSPRSKDLADIHFLQSQHAQKIKHLVPEDSRGFDFCLILQPQEVYAFWADLLDFRVELLGEDLTQAIEEHWKKTLRAKTGYALEDEVQDHKKDLESGTRLLQSQDEAGSPSDSYSIDDSEAKDTVTELKVPNFGLSRFLSSRRAETPAHSEAPSLYTVADRRTFFSTTSNKSRPLSMFERALGPVPVEELYVEDAVPSDGNFQATPRNATVTAGSNTSLVRRKWGSQVVRSATKPAIIASSPTRPLTPAAIPNRMTSNSQKFECQEKSETPNNPHEIRMEDIPNPKIPRGIAARTRGLSEFLPALRRGIVLRKHRPGQEATFCRIISVDGGDTIQVHALSPSQAYPLLREQRRLYNVPGRSSSASASDWSLEPHNEYGDVSSGSLNTSVRQFTRVVRKGVFRLADVVAVQPARREDPRSTADDKGTLTLRRSFSNYSENLAFSLVLRSTFGRSTVGNPTSIEEYEIRWGTGEGSESQFRYFDFEAATEGEYWLVFRGFLLLQRDAAVGRFAEQRAAGIGSHYSRVMGELREKVAQEHEVHQDEFQEPITVGFLERRLVEWRGLDMGYMKGFTAPGAVPPPSDYFLGFKAPGTAIWSRLRNSGLVVQRVYSLDRRQVILKIHCPTYRIMDVAEVLRVKLKTWDGSFASFRQDLIDLYRPLNDPLEESDADALPFEYVFASSVRQQIIDFIVRSRIRDSGAELGQATVKRPSGFDGLGKMIQARVPLHMPGKLDAIYRSWVLYWKEENWTEYRDGKSLSHSGAVEDKSDDGVTDEEDAMGLSKTDTSDSGSLDAVAADESPLDKRMSSTRSQLSLFVPPPLWKRLFLGAFFQPLDSVESYFGEKVAFYFAWLQHTATHLVFLSVAGLLMFICQIASNDFDHPLRPVFAFIVMLWTYVVLVNWRKRANFLAYRWGTLNFKEQETTRPQFRGEFVEDEITGEDVVQYSKWKRWIKYAVSFPVMLIFTFCTLFMILWVHANRDMQLQEYFNETKADFEIDFSISAIGKGITSNSELTREVILDPTFWYLSMILPATVGLCLPLLNFVLSKLAIVRFLLRILSLSYRYSHISHLNFFLVRRC